MAMASWSGCFHGKREGQLSMDNPRQPKSPRSTSKCSSFGIAIELYLLLRTVAQRSSQHSKCVHRVIEIAKKKKKWRAAKSRGGAIETGFRGIGVVDNGARRVGFQ